MSCLAVFSVGGTARPAFQTRRIVGLKPNPFNAGSDWWAILSKDRGIGGKPGGGFQGRLEYQG